MDAHLRNRFLALSVGFAVEAEDGVVGTVETPLFPPDGTEPDFLVLCIDHLSPRRPVISTALVERVDVPARTIHVRARRVEIERLPEHLPLAI